MAHGYSRNSGGQNSGMTHHYNQLMTGGNRAAERNCHARDFLASANAIIAIVNTRLVDIYGALK
jgi:hypothetical protein